MDGAAILLRKELLEQWRSLRLPLSVVVFALIGFSSPLVARFTPEILRAVGGSVIPIVLPTPTAADAVDQLAKNITQLGAFVAILLASGAVAAEKERGTAALLLVRPIGRAAFLLAKLAGIGVTLAASVVVAVAGAWFYTLVLFEPLSVPGTIATGALVWLFLMSWTSLTFLASTLTRSSLAAAGIGIVALIAVGILGIVPVLAGWLPFGLIGVARALALGLDPPAVWMPVAGTVLLIAACVGLAWLSFRRQEL